ncbi:hypothetical protein EXIGLDRAFT_758166 [Exidia glandulosa HHB12029]|uniref:Prefoldin beta-like protein n=1 Tax=Exidia glandulosa HHB12029 TaxID=1314781 RepID=A0A165QN60_EXIGL|nr:hypothetical protein EXIGLDRAFT_758166 [Exidia glandulosa HHB12029]
MASKAPAKPKRLSEQEVQATYQRLQSELQALTGKITELETDAEEHTLVLGTLTDALDKDPERQCFRLVGGVLIQRTVKDVVPDLTLQRDRIKNSIIGLAETLKTREEEFTTLIKEYQIRTIRA